MGCAGGCASERPVGDDPRFRRVVWIALLANGTMFAVELAASLVGRSVALQADALDFLGDSASYAITLLVLGMGVRARARAALFKSATMAAFGLWVIGTAAHRAYMGAVPDTTVMGATATLALLVNVAVAVMLFRFRGGDSNRRSIWLCSRNDALANIAVMLAAGGVLATGTGWPDIAVAAVIATLNLTAATAVLRQALGELRAAHAAKAVLDEGVAERAG